jgi:molecular chaperone IbpA
LLVFWLPQHAVRAPLQIELVREIPEAMKPRRIAINGSPASNVQQIETRAA